MEKANQSWKAEVAMGLLVSAFIVPIIVWINSPESAGEKAAYEQRRCEDGGMALIMSRKFVERELSNPESAQFLRNTGNDYIGECRHKISGIFDAKNGFGATMRSSYSVTMVYHPESKRWSATGLVIR